MSGPPGWDWSGNDSLVLDTRYRERQLPLLRPGPTPRRPVVRSVVLPLPGLASPELETILAELRASAVAPHIWWDGLQRRADRMHATLATALSTTTPYDGSPGVGPVTVRLRGPWVGRWNTGRLYLPVDPAGPVSAAALAGVRADPTAPLLAGWLQLTSDVRGTAYDDLRRIVATHADEVVASVEVPELWVLDSEDDLVLRSRVVRRLPLTSPRNSSRLGRP